MMCYWLIVFLTHIKKNKDNPTGEIKFLVDPCKVHFVIQDFGYEDDYRGWYDTRGCGACNDFCRWVGNSESGGDPTLRTEYHTSFWACQLPHNSYLDYKKEGVFLYKKCTERGANPPEKPIVGTKKKVSPMILMFIRKRINLIIAHIYF